MVDTSSIAIYGKSIGGQATAVIATMLPEYTKVRDYYEHMGKGFLNEIDLQKGGRIISGVKSYPFLYKHLDWPEPE